MNIAAIDIGSNAMRMAIASIELGGRTKVIESFREPVRLGQDVFKIGKISDPMIASSIAAIDRFKEHMNRHQVSRWRAVGTSALREAKNRYEFISQVQWKTGIEVVPIAGDKEAHLVSRAAAAVIDLSAVRSLLIDIGGGSTEVSVLDGGCLTATETFKMGAVRLRQFFSKAGTSEKIFSELVREYNNAIKRKLHRVIGENQVKLLVGTGGNIETLGELRVSVLDAKQNNKLRAKDLDKLIDFIETRPVSELTEKYGLRPDRADVILPAALILQYIFAESNMDSMTIPRVGLRDGLLIEIVEEMAGGDGRLQRDQVVRSAHSIGVKYDYDRAHATRVAHFCEQLFDASQPLHGLGAEDRLLLEVAAILHDIGQFISFTDHHKHSAYIINASPIAGLDPLQRKVTAQIVRYHHKSSPKARHEEFASLSEQDRARVRKMAELLRLADSIDFSHEGDVKALTATLSNGQMSVCLSGDTDITLDRWALQKHSARFEEVFTTKVAISSDKNGCA